MFLQDKKFAEQKKLNRHYFVKNIDYDLPSWEDVLKSFDRCIRDNKKLKILDKLGFVFFEAEKINHVNRLKYDIETHYNRECSAHCYMSLLSESATFGRHNDESDVFFWQILGRSKWYVEDQKVCEYELYPNDLIYIPRGVVHEVNPLEPRVGISFGLDY